MTGRVLEDELVDLADHLDVPDGDDATARMATTVSARIRSGAAPRSATPPWWRRRRTLVPIGILAAAAPVVQEPPKTYH